jgi:O-antigen/teichoic acid export membrane protein
MEENVGAKAKKGIAWTAIYNLFEYIFRIVSGIILARILFPEDFGLMGIAMIAVQFARRITSFGFNMVLVQRKENREEHYDTVFLTNIVLMGLLTSVFIMFSSYLAEFFNNDKLKLIVIVIGFDFVLRELNSVPTAILIREMKFKESGMAGAIEEFVAMFSPVILAIAGFGVWSLVLGSLLGSIAHIISVYYYTRWYPKFRFRIWALKEVFSFGLWVFVNNYMSYFIKKIDYFFIAKILDATQLGYYERAFKLMTFPRNKIFKKINGVMFSAYSRVQESDKKLIKGILRVTTYASIVTYPLMIWMFFAAPSFITVLYGPKWDLTIVPLKIMCISGIFQTFSVIFTPLLYAKGLVGNQTRRQFVYLLILGGTILFSIRWGINGVAWGVTIASFLQLALMVQLTVRKISLPIVKFLKAQKSTIVYGLIQIAVLETFQFFVSPIFGIKSWQMLVSVSILSVGIIIGAHLVIRFKDLDDIFNELFSEIKKYARKVPIIKQIAFFSPKA